MKRINSLSDLLMEELADLLNAENQLVEVLPKMAQASQSLALKTALEAHLEVAKEHAHRIQDVFNNIRQKPQGVVCKTMRTFMAEGEDAVNKEEKSESRDTAILDVMQRAEQYEITGYQTAREHAQDLGHTRIVEILTASLDEERDMDLHLKELAQGMINAQASGGFYIPEGKFKRKENKKKNKDPDISRFISEGNPNAQEPQGNEQEENESKPRNPEEQGDLS